MGSILGQVSTVNSSSGEDYTSDQLVLYADVSTCPSYTTINATVTIATKYTAVTTTQPNYWTCSTPTVTLSTKLPFTVYVYVKMLLATSDPNYSSSKPYIVFYKALSANTTYSNSALTSANNSTVISPGYAPIPMQNRCIQVQGVSYGISTGNIGMSATSLATALNNTSVKGNYVYKVSASTPTITQN